MEIRVVGTKVSELDTPAVVLGVFADVDLKEPVLAELDVNLDGAISRLAGRGEIKGKSGEITSLYSLGHLRAERIVIVGLGKKEGFNPDTWRKAMGEAGRYLQNRGVTHVAVIPPQNKTNAITIPQIAQATVEGMLAGSYSFDKYLTQKNTTAQLEEVFFVAPDGDATQPIEAAMHQGQVMVEAAIEARNLVNEPANRMTPAIMASTARDIAQRYHLGLTILGKKEMQEMGMGAILAVAQGSRQEPQLIVLSYKGREGEGTDLVLVGKGITFDSGGISIKPADKMEEMKTDMAGGASVMAALTAVARLGARINVTAVVPAVENMPGGNAQRPGDIINTMSGKTVEVISTDAEGRLILADAITYAKTRLDAKRLVDVATLTGACIVALGKIYTGAFGNNQGLVDQILAAGGRSGEPIWQMPMDDEYKKLNQSDVADIKNAGSREAGAISAAQFIAEFVGDTPWVHLDIAGTSTTDKTEGYLVKGATGVPVRTLIELILNL